jgi:DNA-binding MarR family transcriptional regulator
MIGHSHGHQHGHDCGTPGHPHGALDLEGVDPLSASVLTEFRKAMHLNRHLLMRLAADKGGHPGRAMVLGALAGHDGISQKDLAEKMHLARPTITIMLQKMEHEGLIERWDDPDDQRLTRIRLTDAGRAQGKSFGDSYKSHIEMTIGALPEADRAEFVRILGLLNEKTAAALKELEA